MESAESRGRPIVKKDAPVTGSLPARTALP
jgi:hypothetical protein